MRAHSSPRQNSLAESSLTRVSEAWRRGSDFIGEIGERLEGRGSGQFHRRRFDALGQIGRVTKILGERKLRMDLKLEGGDASREQ